MSHKASAWAMTVKGLTMGQRVVLYHLADRCNEGHPQWEGRSVCWPSLKLLEKHTELTRRGLTKILLSLETAGAIIRHHDHGYSQAKGNGGEATIYELPTDKVGNEHSLGSNSSLGNQSAQGRELESAKVGNPSSPKPKGEPKEPVIRKSAQRTRLPEDWVLPNEWWSFAAQLGLDGDAIALEADAFRDYWLFDAKPGKDTKADWFSTWRGWCRRELKDQRRRGPPKTPGRSALMDELLKVANEPAH